MTPTNRRSPTSTLVHQSAITQATDALKQLPGKPKDVWSVGEVLDLILDTIRATLTKGYSHAEVAEMLTERGIRITPTSLKYYLAKHPQATLTPLSTKTRSSRTRPDSVPPLEPTEAAIAPVAATILPIPSDKTAAFRKRGIEEVMSYLLDESDMEGELPNPLTPAQDSPKRMAGSPQSAKEPSEASTAKTMPLANQGSTHQEESPKGRSTTKTVVNNPVVNAKTPSKATRSASNTARTAKTTPSRKKKP